MSPATFANPLARARASPHICSSLARRNDHHCARRNPRQWTSPKSSGSSAAQSSNSGLRAIFTASACSSRPSPANRSLSSRIAHSSAFNASIALRPTRPVNSCFAAARNCGTRNSRSWPAARVCTMACGSSASSSRAASALSCSLSLAATACTSRERKLVPCIAPIASARRSSAETALNLLLASSVGSPSRLRNASLFTSRLPRSRPSNQSGFRSHRSISSRSQNGLPAAFSTSVRRSSFVSPGSAYRTTDSSESSFWRGIARTVRPATSARADVSGTRPRMGSHAGNWGSRW